jgi:AcrR family transcriptional regulator
MVYLCNTVATVRGDELRQHILFKAKDVFLESGFERASMDAIAARAETTKRTLYAHFEDKERLFLAVVDLVRELLGKKLKTPADYADDPTEALALFCSRFQRILQWGPAIRTCRLGIAGAEHFPEGSARLYEAIFGTAQKRVEQFLQESFDLPQRRSVRIAEALLSQAVRRGFILRLFGFERVTEKWLEDNSISPTFDRMWIERTVAQFAPRSEGTASQHGSTLCTDDLFGTGRAPPQRPRSRRITPNRQPKLG